MCLVDCFHGFLYLITVKALQELPMAVDHHTCMSGADKQEGNEDEAAATPQNGVPQCSHRHPEPATKLFGNS
jgi:hypothetical protein